MGGSEGNLFRITHFPLFSFPFFYLLSCFYLWALRGFSRPGLHGGAMRGIVTVSRSYHSRLGDVGPAFGRLRAGSNHRHRVCGEMLFFCLFFNLF